MMSTVFGMVWYGMEAQRDPRGVRACARSPSAKHCTSMRPRGGCQWRRGTTPRITEVKGLLTFDLRRSVNSSPPGTKSMTM